MSASRSPALLSAAAAGHAHTSAHAANDAIVIVARMIHPAMMRWDPAGEGNQPAPSSARTNRALGGAVKERRHCNAAEALAARDAKTVDSTGMVYAYRYTTAGRSFETRDPLGAASIFFGHL